jgi:multidrug efflux pump
MLSNFFIHRPVFSWVMAILLMGAGLLAILRLPIQQFPEIAPPEITITARYPGANAETVDTTVTQVMEQNLVGIDNLRYFAATSSADGTAQIRLTFETGADADIGQVQTQNKVSESLARLPIEVQQFGVAVEKSTRAYALIVAFYSQNGEVDDIRLGDFIASNIIEPVGRIKGVGEITAFSPEHSLRIWLDPDKLFYFRVTALEVMAAVREQNNQLPSGELGGAPNLVGQQLNAPIVAPTLMSDPENFRRIVLRTRPDGAAVTLGDVARVEIGSENYSTIRRFNRRPAAGFGVSLTNEANALETIAAVKERIEALKPTFPADTQVAFPVDVSPFIRLSVTEVAETLIIAVVLVLLVMFVFLQSWRTTLIPGLAIPVVLLGTLAGLSALDYSINVLTLFALVLSIGMLVDDAIVVTENVKRALDQDPHLTPREAAKRSMAELWGALLATTAVLWAVFIPMAFFPGATGVVYRQFSLTMLIAMTLSLFIALTFSPALAGSLLRRNHKQKESKFFSWFNYLYAKAAAFYVVLLRWLLSHFKTGLLTFAVLSLVSWLAFKGIPRAFLPDEDQGRVFAIVDGPPNATFDRMMGPVQRLEDFFLDEMETAVESLFTVVGFSFAGRGQNAATAFVNLKPFEERRGEATTAFGIADRARRELAGLRTATVVPVTPPAIPELSRATGFEFRLVDQARLGREQLQSAMEQLLARVQAHPSISYVRLNALEDESRYDLEVDFRKAQSLGLAAADINATLSAAWGGNYINDYLEKGRIKRVFVQGEARARTNPDDLRKWFIRNQGGEMVSMGDFITGRWSKGPPQLQRFNGLEAFELQGEATRGVSTGEAMELIRGMVAEMPSGVALEWTGLSYEEEAAGTQLLALYALSLLAIFLGLAALYESWSIPLAVILTLPVGLLGAALLVWALGLSNDIYFTVGILLTMGLAAKDAILIIEFARLEIAQGKSVMEATIRACEQRLRPILMTSFTFMLGVLPLVLARGPGSGAQNSIGASLLGGIISTTFLVLLFGPLFFVLIMQLRQRWVKT